MPSSRLIEFGDDGTIIIETRSVKTRFNVRFPSEKEQAAGITEVPRSQREKKVKSGNKSSS